MICFKPFLNDTEVGKSIWSLVIWYEMVFGIVLGSLSHLNLTLPFSVDFRLRLIFFFSICIIYVYFSRRFNP